MPQSNLAAAPAGSRLAAGRHESKKTDKDQKKHDQDRKNDEALDEALEESFPASDPPSASQPTGPGPAGDPATKP